MKKRHVPIKNYIILVFIVLAVLALTFYLAAWYKTIKEYYQNNSVIAGVISKIEVESLPSYLLDNPTTIIYIASSNDQEVKDFEKKFKKYIIDENLNYEIIYLDVNGLTSDYIDESLLKYSSSSLKKMKKIITPNLIYFENGEISDILYVKENTIKKSDVVKFLERNNVVEDD